MSVDHLDRKRDLIIGTITVLTLLSISITVIAGQTGPVPYLLGGGLVLILSTLAYTHTRKGRQDRTDDLRDHVRTNELARGDLKHLRSMLASQAQEETRTALGILEEPYSQDDTEQSLMAFIAGDSRDTSVTIVHEVIDLLEDETSEIARQALSVLHTTEVSDPQAVADAADTMIGDLRDLEDPEIEAIRERAIFLAKNRRKIHTQTLRDSHDLIQDLLTVKDPATATMAALLIGDLIRRDRGVDESDIEAIVANLQTLLDRYSETTGSQQAHLRSFITAHLSVLRRAAQTDPASLQDHLKVLRPVLSMDRPQQRRAADIARALTEDHPRSLEPIFGDLLRLLDDTDDQDLHGIVLEALAHMGPRVTEGQQAFAETIAGHLGGDHRRPAAYLLFRLADEAPGVVAQTLPDPTPVLRDNDPQTRRYGFGILARLAPTQPHIIEAHLETITSALEDDSEAGTTALTALFQYTEATDTGVLEDLGQQLVPYLDEDGSHGRMAATMLTEAIQEDPDRYSSLRPVLEDMLERDDPAIVVQACRGLTEIGDSTSRDRLQGRLGDSEHRVRVAAAKAFTAIGDRLEADGGDRNPLEGASERLAKDKETIAEMAAEEGTSSSITIEGDGDIHGDILIYGDKEVTEVDADIDESTEIRDSVQKDVQMDRD